jgi:hypothetical protein
VIPRDEVALHDHALRVAERVGLNSEMCAVLRGDAVPFNVSRAARNDAVSASELLALYGWGGATPQTVRLSHACIDWQYLGAAPGDHEAGAGIEWERAGGPRLREAAERLRLYPWGALGAEEVGHGR